MDKEIVDIIKNNVVIVNEITYDYNKGKYYNGETLNVGDEALLAFGVVSENPEDSFYPMVQLIYLKEEHLNQFELVENVCQGKVLPVIRLKD